MRATSSYSIVAFLSVLIGFVFVLSKYSFLPPLGFLLVLLGIFAPFYRDSLGRHIHHFLEKHSKSKDISLKTEAMPSDVDNIERTKAIIEHKDVEDSGGKSASLINLRDAGLSDINFVKADLRGRYLRNVDFSGIDLRKINLSGADLTGAKFSGAILSGANLSMAYCMLADFSGADLVGADLSWAVLTGANLKNANLTGSSIYGISVLKAQLEEAIQADLIITPPGEAKIAVDNLVVGQFVSFLLNNRDFCNAVNTVNAKVVLILGRFNSKRKKVLNALRTELRNRGYIPVVFDFDSSSIRDITAEISALAHMSRFVIADIGDSESMTVELQHVVPNIPSIPIQPLLQSSSKVRNEVLVQLETKYPWFLNVYRYKDVTELLGSLQDHVIGPPEKYYDSEHAQDGESFAPAN